MRCPRGLGGIHIESGPLPEIIGVIIGHTIAARACIREHERDALLRRPALCAGLYHRILMGAGQAREIP